MPASIKQPFHFWQFFFSLKGRTSRLPFAFFILPYRLFFWGAPRLIQANHFDTSLILMMSAAISILQILLLWPVFTITFKRLHDIGLSGFWALIMFFPPLINMLISVLRARAMMNSLPDPTPSWAGALIYFLFSAVGAGTLLLAVWPGNKNPNRYGATPRRDAQSVSDIF